MNTSIISSTNGGSPHIAASSRSAATSLRRQPEAAGDLGERHLAALHQPRQHHEQAPRGAPRRSAAPAPVTSAATSCCSQSTTSPRARRAGRRTSAWSSRPSTHDRKAGTLAHGTVDLDRPVVEPGRHPLGTELALDAGGARRRRRAPPPRRRRRRRRRAASGRSGTPSRRSKPAGRSNAPASPAVDVAGDPVDAVRPLLVVARGRGRRRTRSRRAAAGRTGRAGGRLPRYSNVDGRPRAPTPRAAPAARPARAPSHVTATSRSSASSPSFHSASRPRAGRTAATATCRARISSGSRWRSPSS